MIQLTTLDDRIIYVNPHQIETMLETPDTVLRMLSERRIIVKEDCETVLGKIIQYRKSLGLLGNDMTA